MWQCTNQTPGLSAAKRNAIQALGCTVTVSRRRAVPLKARLGTSRVALKSPAPWPRMKNTWPCKWNGCSPARKKGLIRPCFQTKSCKSGNDSLSALKVHKPPTRIAKQKESEKRAREYVSRLVDFQSRKSQLDYWRDRSLLSR